MASMDNVITLATANVNTLLDAKRASGNMHAQAMGRIQLLEMAMDSECIDIIGIQEGRMQVDQQRTGHLYDQYIASASKTGCYGSQVWVRRKCAFKVSTFVPHSSRIVEVVGDIDHIDGPVHVFSAHAPHELDKAPTKDSFWDSLTAKVLKAVQAGHSVILLIDGNARMGSCADERVGPYDAETENDNGERFRNMLRSTGLWATSTWFQVGYTWRSSYDTLHRIDYICLSTNLHRLTVSCEVKPMLGLARSAKEDHRCVAAALGLSTAKDKPLKRQKRVRAVRRLGQWLNVDNMRDPMLMERFEYEMWFFNPVHTTTIDDQQEELVKFIKMRARAIFGPPIHKPIHPWISERTWGYVKHIGLIRRTMHAMRWAVRSRKVLLTFLAWASAVPRDFMPGDVTVRRSLGWVAVARLKTERSVSMCIQKMEGMAFHSIVLLQSAAHSFITNDRLKHFADATIEAQKAFLRGDMRGTFAVVKRLAGHRIRPPKSVRLECGEVTTDESQRQQRWQRHFAGVLGGKIVEDRLALRTKSVRCLAEGTIDLGPTRVQRTICRMGRNKAVGKDEIPVELLRCGGFAMAVQLSRAYERVAAEEQWPIAWKGGRQIDLYKGKGDALECGCSRGLLISDHMGKVLTSILKDECDGPYNMNIPKCQHGAVTGKGTDFAHHFILSCIDFASAIALCICVLFVDLAKAYDGVLREFLMGLPQHIGHDLQSAMLYLRSIGVPEDVARYVLEYLDSNGPVLEQWGVSSKTVHLINALHSGAWFQYGECQSYVLTTTGGRQGCKLGGLVFNGVYALPLRMLEDELATCGMVMRLRLRSDIFSSVSDPPMENVLDVAFVDDLAVVLFARCPRILTDCVQRLLKILIRLCSIFKFAINWDRGKTEAFIALRGKHASSVYSTMRQGDKFGIGLDDNAVFLHVVSKYKHLGSETDAKGSNMPYVKHRASSAMAAYAPISVRVFGCCMLELHLRKSLCASLILSRLLFNAHLRVLRPREFAHLKRVYMRVIRRIAGCPQFDETAGTDFDARVAINVPSLDCLLLQRRLSLGASTGAHAQRCRSGPILPWVRQLITDMSVYSPTSA